MKVTLQEIEQAEKRIGSLINKTETALSVSATQILGSEIYLKYENLQATGSFKIRGALNKILQLTEEQKRAGVVASSAGNHAQGVALSAKKAGVKSVIVMPKTAPLVKIQATKDYGAEVVLAGEIYDEAFEHAQNLQKEHGYTFVHPYQDEAVIAGQGTIGLEMLRAVPDLDTVVVPIGGGGLISGISTAFRALNPRCKVIGVQSALAPSMYELYTGQKVNLERRAATIADGIAIKKPSQIMFDSFIKNQVDDVVTVTEDEIAEAIVFLLEKAKTVTEGSGAVGFAATLHRKFKLGKKNCVLLCGGNIDLNIMARVINLGLIQKGRLVEISMIVDDVPGNLNRMTQAIADLGANVLEVRHDRIFEGLLLRETKIDFMLEIKNKEHGEQIRQALIKVGGRTA